MKTKEKRYKEFVLYFDTLDDKGIAWGMSDLRNKAIELNLPIPKNVDGKLVWDEKRFIKRSRNE